MTDRIVDWFPDGKSLLFASSRESGKQRFNQFYKVSKGGGLAEKLPLPYAEFGSFSPDGKKICFYNKNPNVQNLEKVSRRNGCRYLYL